MIREKKGGIIGKILAGWGIISLVLVLFLCFSQPKAMGTFVSVLGLIKLYAVNDISINQVINGATVGVAGALNDPYSQYLDVQTRKDLSERMSGEFGGVGVYVLQDEAGRMRLISPIEGTPAFEAGVKHNDIVMLIDGKSVVNMRQDEVVAMLRGEPETEVAVTVYRESESKEIEFTIIRKIISVPSVSVRILEGNEGIAYVRLDLFQTHSAEEMQEKVSKLLEENEVKGLIVDVRDNGGGDFDAALSIASLFLNGEDIVQVADAKGRITVHKSMPGGYQAPMIVLVNRNSASASEILAGALQDNDRALIVGEKTYGKALVQTVFVLPDGGALKLTTAKYYTPNEKDINEVGIVPDYIVEQPPSSGQDLQLQKAVELLLPLIENL